MFRTLSIPYLILATLLISLTINVGCTRNAEYEIKDSGTLPAGDGMYQINWLDNERVLFPGIDPGTTPLGGVPEYGLYIWDTQKNKVERYGDVWGTNICYYKGNILYPYKPFKEGKGLLYYYGQFGQEKNKPAEPLPFGYDKFNCNPYTASAERFSPEQVPLFNLREDHGSLQLNYPRTSTERQIKFYPAKQNSGIVLPISEEEVWKSDTLFYESLNAYVLQGPVPKGGGGKVTQWPQGISHPIYLLYPDGKVKKIEVPYFRELSASSTRYFLIKEGIFAVTHQSTRNDYGAYVIKNNKLNKIITGGIQAVGISADGCKVAINHAPTHDWRKNRTLKVINFCSGDKK